VSGSSSGARSTIRALPPLAALTCWPGDENITDAAQTSPLSAIQPSLSPRASDSEWHRRKIGGGSPRPRCVEHLGAAAARRKNANVGAWASSAWERLERAVADATAAKHEHGEFPAA
jgi:hypothetical protein